MNQEPLPGKNVKANTILKQEAQEGKLDPQLVDVFLAELGKEKRELATDAH